LLAARGGDAHCGLRIADCGLGNAEMPPSGTTSSPPGGEASMQLVDPTISDRPLPRFVAPAPALSPEKTEQLLTQQGARGRKMASRMKQGQLPLEILAKGRFERSEPTLHQ